VTQWRCDALEALDALDCEMRLCARLGSVYQIDMRVVVLAVAGLILVCCGSSKRDFGGEQSGGASGSGGASTAMSGSGGRNVAGRGGGIGSQLNAGAAGADQTDTTMAGAAGLGGPDDVGPGGAAGTEGGIDCTTGQYDDGSSCHDLTVCGATEFEQSPAKPDQDRVCAKLTQCSANEYEKTAPTAKTNRECSGLSVCGAGMFVSVKPGVNSDRQCSACPASTFSSILNSAACAAWSTCKSGESESVAPNATTDRVCSVCGSGKYGSGGQCLALTVCKSTEYEAAPATATSDRKCSALTVCQPGSRQTAAPTATTDRQCAACSSGTYSTQANATSCAPWTACTANEYESTAPSLLVNRVCTALTSCAAGTRIVKAATATSDRSCQACASGTFTTAANLSTCDTWANCAAGYSAVAGSATKDRTCNACASGFFSTTSNAAACSAWKTCASNQTLTKAGTATSDAVCTDKPICGTAVDRVCTVDCPCASGEGVCTASNQCASGVSCVVGGGKKKGRTGNTCLTAHCDNDIKDADETSVDCGGVCGCRATFEVVSYKNMPSGAAMGSLNSMSGDGSRFAATLSRSGTAYPAAIASDGTVTELAAYGAYGYGYVISADGNVIVGEMGCANPPTCSDHSTSQVRWAGAAAPLIISINNGAVRYVSSSGTYVGGTYFDATLDRNSGFVINGNALNAVSELRYVSGMTKDGKYLGGDVPDANGGGVGLWFSTTRAVTPLKGSTWTSTSITAINGNTPVVIGQGYISAKDLQVGYRWKAGQFTELGVLSGTTTSAPSAVSNDGSTVVGTVDPSGFQQAFIWTDADKLRYLVDELKARGYEPPSDMLLKYPKFISEDGKTIVGVEVLTPPTFWRVVLN
jgi:TNFR/NGFR cysteine-rich protein